MATDFYLLDERLTDEERAIRDRLRAFCDREVTPIINGYWERAEFPFELVPKIAELGLAGGVIDGYDCPGMSATAAGLVSMEWARADGSIGTFFGVHSSLAMQTIHLLGSEEQREHWLPRMAALEAIGAFGLTEPAHGSDAVALETSARRDGDEYVLEGAKKWIGNASIADVTIIWARGEDGQVGGYLVEKGAPGFHTEVITGKTSLRAVWQAEITLDGVRVPAESRLPGCRSFRDVARVLTLTRYTVAWRALGVALAAYEAALAYAKEREQFGHPLASFQLVQDKLSRMVGEITAMQLLCLRLSELAGDERLTPGMASLAKMNHAAKARAIVADARDILGGNGILLEHHVARHHADMEAVFTFEGTDSIQSLIVGREITGIQAIAPPRGGG
jgi:glutaryl-CoA dehydrogenase